MTAIARYRDLWPRRHKFRRRVSVISSFIIAVKSARVSATAGKTPDKKANGADLRFSFALSPPLYGAAESLLLAIRLLACDCAHARAQ